LKRVPPALKQLTTFMEIEFLVLRTFQTEILLGQSETASTSAPLK
jgi:hypothetical protein